MRAGRLAWLPPLLARGAMGVRFIAAGAGKLDFLLFRFEEAVRRSAPLGLTPGVLRYGGGLVSVVEILAGSALLLGIRARSAALTLLGVLGMYSLLDLVRTGHPMDRSTAFDLSVYAVLLLWIAIAGPGPIALSRA